MTECDILLVEWFTKRNLAKNTRNGYTDSINKYIKYLNRDGADYTLEKLLKEAEADERSGELLRYRKINKHIISFINHLREIGNAPSTVNNRIAAILSFYVTMDITTPYIQKNKGNTVLEKNQGPVLTREEILKLVEVANIRDEAIIYTMSLTGLAQNEVRKLTLRKLANSIEKVIDRPIRNLGELFDSERDIKNNILTLYLKRDKVNHSHFCFLPPEAHQRIFSYLKTRLESRNPEIHPKMDGFIFVNRFGEILTTSGIIKIFTKLGVTNKLSHETGTFRKHRSHGLRKYFISTIGNSTGDNTLADYLAGHVPDTVKKAYLIPDEKSYLERYKKAYPFISLDKVKVKDITTEEFKIIKEENKALKEQIDQQDQTYRNKIDALTGRVDDMEEIRVLGRDFESSMDKLGKDYNDSKGSLDELSLKHWEELKKLRTDK